MKILEWPKRLFYSSGSKLALFLVKRRLKRGRGEPHVWLVLARLYEVRGEYSAAIETLTKSLEIFPNNPILKQHLERIRKLASSSGS